MSDDDGFEEYILPELVHKIESSTQEVPSIKSQELYKKRYNDFLKWQQLSNNQSFEENTLLSYFKHMSERTNSASLWAKYSMLKTMLNINKNIDIDKYSNLKAFLKEKHKGYKAKRAAVFSSRDLNRFLTTAPDSIFISEKVALIIGVTGACRREELRGLKIDNLRFENSLVIVSIPGSNNRVSRTFVIEGKYFDIIEKYVSLRPPFAPPCLLLCTRNGQSTNNPIGINKIGTMPKEIATWLGLPSPERYTGHTFRKTSKNLIANTGASITTFKRRGLRSVAERLIAESVGSNETNQNQIDSFTADQSDDGDDSSLDIKPIVDPNLIQLVEEAVEMETTTDETYKNEPVLPLSNNNTKEHSITETIKTNNLKNPPWVDLARRLGIIASKFVGPKNQNITINFCACGGEDKKYAKNALLLGLLTGRVKDELNLANVQKVADKLRLKVNEQSWNDVQSVLFVKAGGHEIKGSLACSATVLMSVDNTPFKDYVCLLQDNISLYKTKTPEDLAKIVTGHIVKSVAISNVSVSGNWVVMQTNNPVTIPIDGIDSF
ncbi:uncharacterized protein LOC106645125 isoform X2 [Copidosoma floridanum]|uniref:uncharacterized protein LOC106645125 isoform X2 n=1 Tax=Copidosoma floridanum TaxID=29053 RepID=UPI0006C95F16|nr:uncharacterized protein LOC106645125 isoform X2 [Copidosoma floridanum]